MRTYRVSSSVVGAAGSGVTIRTPLLAQQRVSVSRLGLSSGRHTPERSVTARAAVLEPNHGVQLSAVGGDTELPVDPVEEEHAGEGDAACRCLELLCRAAIGGDEVLARLVDV